MTRVLTRPVADMLKEGTHMDEYVRTHDYTSAEVLWHEKGIWLTDLLGPYTGDFVEAWETVI